MIHNDIQKTSKYICECGNIYTYHSGLYRHKKTCLWKHIKVCNFEDQLSINFSSDKHLETNTIEKNKTSDNLITYLIKENSEFKQMMIEQQNMMMEFVKNGTHNITNNTNTNSHNKTFNLQVFLNETCKDAMNMSDFLNQLQLTTKDLG